MPGASMCEPGVRLEQRSGGGSGSSVAGTGERARAKGARVQSGSEGVRVRERRVRHGMAKGAA